MTDLRLRRGAVVAAGASVAVVSAALIPVSAQAATDICTDQHSDAEEITDGVCQVVFDEADTLSFVPPNGLDTLSALVIGAGGGSYVLDGDPEDIRYGGGGGEVKYVDAVDATNSITVIVGAGGDGVIDGAIDGIGGNGGDSKVNSVVANGGNGGNNPIQHGGTSGSGKSGFETITFDAAGGGAGDEGGEFIGGDGLYVGDLDGINETLFANILEYEYGHGGSTQVEEPGGRAGSGGSVEVDGSMNETVHDGVDGLVMLRWFADDVDPNATDEDTDGLPETGANLSAWALIAGMAAAASGAIALAGRKRRGLNRD